MAQNGPEVKRTCAGLGFSKCQAPCLGTCMPAQWMSCVMNGQTRSSVSWKLQGPGTRSMIEGPAGLKANAHKALTQELVKTFPNFELKTFTFAFTADEQSFKYYFYTPNFQWIDVLTGTIKWNGDFGEAKFQSRSSAICPASCPGAFCCSAALCCVPFLDHGKNKEHLEQLKEALDKAGIRVDDWVPEEEAGGAPSDEAMVR